MYKIKRSMIKFDNLTHSNDFNFNETFQDEDSYNNIDFFKKALKEHEDLEHVLWTAFYHCLNTYGSNHEFLSVLDKNNN